MGAPPPPGPCVPGPSASAPRKDRPSTCPVSPVFGDSATGDPGTDLHHRPLPVCSTSYPHGPTGPEPKSRHPLFVVLSYDLNLLGKGGGTLCRKPQLTTRVLSTRRPYSCSHLGESSTFRGSCRLGTFLSPLRLFRTVDPLSGRFRRGRAPTGRRLPYSRTSPSSPLSDQENERKVALFPTDRESVRGTGPRRRCKVVTGANSGGVGAREDRDILNHVWTGCYLRKG